MENVRRIRAFVALQPPAAWVEPIAVLQRQLKRTLGSRAFKWVEAENIHITLRFFGSVPEEDVGLICAALDSVARLVTPFTIESAALGCFPSTHRARVLWLGLRGGEENLGNLNARVVDATRAFGQEPEDRPFKPHLTLARVNEMPREVVPRLEKALESSIPLGMAWKVTEVLLMQSHLSPTGARYEVLHSARLGGSVLLSEN